MQHFGSGFGQDPSEPWGDTAVAIVGMACRFAGARSIDDYWANLCGGVTSIIRYSDEELIAAGVDPALLADPRYVKAGAPLADMECFDATLFGLSPRDAALMDPQHRHFLECAWEALENAGHSPERFAGAIGVFAGSGHNGYMAANLLGDPALRREVGPFQLQHAGNDKDFLTTRVSYLLNLRGPSINIQTACSTSLVATHMAIQSLLSNECDMALAGGVSIGVPHRQGYMVEEGGILSPDGDCRPFDAASKGTVIGSGAGIIVLRRLRDAMESGDHIYAVIRGTAINNDGSGKVSYHAPSVDGQAHAITEALSIADVDAGTVGYVEAHGTGTPVGDSIEIAALTQAFRKDSAEIGYCGLGSVKANIGHADTAAGVASLIKVALSLHHAQLSPSRNFTKADPASGLAESPFVIGHTLRPWARLGAQPLRAGVNSLGVGGTNAHAVLEEAPRRAPGDPSRSHQLLILSALSADVLDANMAALAEHLAAHPGLNLADVAYTMSVGRQALGRRRVVVAENATEAAAALADPASPKLFSADALADRGVAFLFHGAGSHYVAMGAGLYRSEPLFRSTINDCIDRMKRIAGIDLRPVLLPPTDGRDFARDMLERPSVALPALFAVQVALGRLLMSWGARPAGMIGRDVGEYAAAHLAGVFGLEDALRIVHLRGELSERGSAAPDEFHAMLRTVPMQAPALPFVSSLTGNWITPAEAVSAGYWARHLEEAGRFDEGLARLREAPDQVLLEVGPGRAAADAIAPLRTLRQPEEEAADTAFLLGTLGRLWALGVEVNWGRYWIDEKRLRLPLPTYRFERQRHWIEPAVQPVRAEDGSADKRADMADWFYEPHWRRTALPAAQASTAAALIFEDALGIGAAIARHLRAAGRAAILVRPGRHYRHEAADRFTIDPRKPGDYAALLKALAARGRLPGQIYHLWLTTGFWRGWRASDGEQIQRRGFDSLRFLTQALAAHEFAAPVQIALVSDGVQRVCDEAVLSPAKATVLGPCRVIRQEYPHLHVRSIDLAVQQWSDAGRSRIADALIAELASPDVAEAIAYRVGERWTQGFQPAPRGTGGTSRLRPRGVYLITGGMGGPGLALARHLAETQRARLALIGRTAVPPRESWEAELARLSADDPPGRRLRDLLAIEEAGGEVLAIAADMADVGAMRRAIRQVRACFGAIDGVFHAAGLVDDDPVSFGHAEVARTVRMPSVLEEALGAAQPDFLALFSSVSAIAGAVGQADQAAAGAFLDAYAQARRADERTRVVSIGWSPWETVAEGSSGMLPEQGFRALERILSGPDAAHVIVSPRPLEAEIERMRATHQPSVPSGRSLPEGSAAALPATEAERLIAGLWTEMLGIEPVLRTDSFFDLGGRSSQAVQLASRLRELTGRTLPLSALFENPTVQRLAAILDPNSAPLAHEAITAPAAAGLVTIRAGGDRPPLFLVHDGLGETLLYRGLALRLHAGHAVYGIEPKRRPDGGFAHTRVDEMAADYVGRIQKLRPHGPYLLAGLCAGGVLALEMARRLQDKGETVAFVGIMDAADVDAGKRRLYATRSRLERVRELLSNAGGLGVIPALLRKVCNYCVWQVRSRLERRQRLQLVDDMRGAETGAAGLSFMQLYELAHEAHRPQGLFAGGDVALFRATSGDGTPEDIPFAEIYTDCILGWGKRVADEVELVPVPGGHVSLLQEPHVETLARLLQQRLDDSLARWAPGDGAGPGRGRPASAIIRPSLVPAEMLR
ncbi:type I polyketide synthase [Sphingomonas sp. PR090111-T3T-6A]|uniref:type I polyketide synthase n=1 Tax=Sphingomonas sp. PR090111-T3T-6A TaxID=685778 RepID=UPI000377B23C|nr:type I polyketide synthase [Sphingomonas sp. PR090111-T3T-6A]